MALPKGLIKKYHGDLKKAWAAYRGRGGKSKKRASAKKSPGRKKKRAKPAKRRGVKHHAHKTGNVPVTHRKGSKMSKRKRVKHAARRAGRRVKSAVASRPGQVVMMALEATVGGVVTSMAINKMAPVSASPIMKAGIQAGLGLAAVMLFKNKHVKSAGAGAVIAAMMSAAQSTFKLSALAGPSSSRTLTAAELRQLTSGNMNLPLNMPLSGPVPAGSGFKGGFGS